MRPPSERPTVRDADAPGQRGATEESHPAFAQIGASRVSGRTNLYGSDFEHHHYMTIRIAASTVKRDLSHDWHHEGAEYIEVALSEAQWATFVSTPNMGSGVPCTLTRLNRRLVPEIEGRPKRVEQFRGELEQHLRKVEADLAQLSDQVEAGAGKRALRDTIHQIRMNLTPNLAYVGKAFGEHVERTTEAAKIEVEAYVTGVVMRAGLRAVQDAPVEFLNADNKEGE